jgi:hypothetical protein
MIALLFDHLWQYSIFAAGTGLLVLALRRNSASARFRLCFVASLTFLIPLVLVPSAIVQAETSGPHPGTEAAVRAQIEGWEKRQPVTDGMVQATKDATHQQQPTIQMIIDGLGPMRSIVFRGRDERDWDVYLATFEHGALTWSIAPLINGKIGGILFSPAIDRSDSGPSPGTEEAVRQNIAGLSAGAPAYQIMMPGTANATRQQLKGLEDMAKALGPLKTLTFKDINPRGWDTYHAVYENGEAQWTIQPLINGKVGGILITNAILNHAEPHPDREASLRRYVESLEKGTPNYEDMVPDLADTVRAQLPQILETINLLGPLQSINFEHTSAGGADVYLVTFEHGKVEWNIGPLAEDGKAKTRGYRVL